MSDISDEDENVQFISDLSSGEDELPIQKNKPRCMKRKKLLAAGRKKAVKTDYIGMSPSKQSWESHTQFRSIARTPFTTFELYK